MATKKQKRYHEGTLPGRIFMRSLKITLYSKDGTCIPAAYNSLLQGALYSFWKNTDSYLHNQGYAAEEKTYRLFTFSQLTGKSSFDKEKKEITYRDTISFTVRSPEEKLIEDLAGEIAQQGLLRLGNNVLPVVNISTEDRLLFPKRALIKMITPITLHRTLEDGYTQYLEPTSAEFASDLQANCLRKAAAFGFDAGLVQIIPLEETLKKRVVQFKGTNITGWFGEFILAAQPETMAFLYNTGLGARNSQGFGMFDIVDKPL